MGRRPLINPIKIKVMNTVNFVVGLDRGQFIQKEVESFPGKKSNWKFEITKEEGIDWLHVEITDMTPLDALMLFHAGISAGIDQSIIAIKGNLQSNQ